MADLSLADRIRARVRSVLGLVERPEAPPASADYAGSTDRRPPYDPLTALSAFAAFPWVFACVCALVDDQLSRPFQLSRGVGAETARIDRHPLLDLLARPGSRTAGEILWPQLLADRALAGNAYALILFSGSRPVGLVRLHPKRVQAVVDQTGQIEAYTYDGAGIQTRYPADAVIHWRGPSWTDDPRAVFGTGAIEALNKELQAEQALQSRTATQAKRGRPDALASPAPTASGPATAWTTTQTKEFADKLNEVFERRDGGVAVIGAAAKLEILGWSPRDLEFPAQRQLTREGVLAVFGVPPTRLQLPTANYAQSTDAMTQYWLSIVGRSRDFCKTLISRLGPLFGLTDATLSQDFSDVPYLQAERSARLQRVSTHILNGMSAADAYAYEGFSDAPVSAEPAPEPTAPEPTAPEPAPRAVQTPEQDRARAWEGWVARSQAPAERRLRGLAAGYLRALSARVAAAVQDAPDLAGLTAAQLAPDSEAAAVLAWLAPAVRQIQIRGWREAAAVLGEIGAPETALIPARATEAAQLLLTSTRAELARQIRAGIDAGDSAADLAARVRGCAAFSPARAQTIARTEATKALNDGAADAINAAARAGINARKMWLSSRDPGVRAAHRALDGQIADAGKLFRVLPGVEGAGQEAAYPGAFRDAAQSCNCRCTVIPVLE